MRSAKLRESLAKLISSSVNVSTVLDVGIQHSSPVNVELLSWSKTGLSLRLATVYVPIKRPYATLSRN